MKKWTLLLLVGVSINIAATVKNETGVQPTFNLFELRVKGNTVLDSKVIERTVYPYLGVNKTVADVEQARQALENVYRTQGYQTVVVDIPEQNVENGLVQLKVTEGKISRFRVKGSRYFSLNNIKGEITALAEGFVPNMTQMQEQLAVLEKQSADRKIVPIMRAGRTPGELEVDLKVKDEFPLHGSLEMNGRNSSNTTRSRLVANIRYDNLWQKFHSASLMFQTAPEKSEEVQVWAGTYVMPIFDHDTRLALYMVHSASESSVASAGALSVIGNGTIYGLRLIKPLNGTSEYFHSLTVGMDYKDFEEDLALIGADNIATPIRYLPFMAQYRGNYRGDNSLFSFDVGVNFAIRGLISDEQEFEDKRFLARSNYFYFTTGLEYQNFLPWGMEIIARFNSQIADSPLISNEQFAIGGYDTVRGYFETQTLSDHGIVGSLELYTPRLVPNDWAFVDKFRALVFVDGGKGWIIDALEDNPDSYELASVGIGLRFQMWKYLVGDLDLAFAMIEQGEIKSGDARLDFNIAMEF